MDDPKDLAAVRKELQAVKTRAVGKIKSLQQQVDALQTQLRERPPVAPPDEPSSDEEAAAAPAPPPAAALARRREK